MSIDQEPHLLRDVAESFGIDAGRYDRSRPAYPDELIQRVVDAAPGIDFLDVGCGTGIGARQYRASGINVLGVDVDTRMAEFARDTGIDVEIGKFEEWDPNGRTFDAVVAGQAWHWVDPVRGAAKAGQVLRQHGLLALYWHVFDPPTEVAEPFEEAMNQVAPDGPLKTPGLELQLRNRRRAVEGIHAAGGFDAPEEWQFEWHRRYTRDQWLDHLATTGQLTILEPPQLATVLNTVGAAVDSIGGEFSMQYVTLATAAKLTP
jgi:SAM-dependent methyltransferase